MTLNSVRIRTLGATAAVIAAGMLPGAAQAAGISVVTAARQQEKVIGQVFDTVHFSKLSSASQARQYVPKLRAIRARLEHGATLVASATATTRRQREGQTEWVKAVHGIATGIGQLQSAYEDLADGRNSAALPLLTKAKQTVAAAAKLGGRADQLLGIGS
jgi:hypothetical protein